MLSKFGRWAAGRIQGSKGVQKYDNWMSRNPWAKAGLDIAGGIALGAATGGIGGALAAKSGALGMAGKGLALAGKGARLTGMMPGGSYNPTGGGRSRGRQLSQLEQLNNLGMMELNDLRDASRGGPRSGSGISNDPLDGVSYDAPGQNYIDRAANAEWANDPGFDGTIENDALTEFRNARFDGTIANDPAAGFDQRFSQMYDPGIDGPDALNDAAAADAALMSMGTGPGGFNAPTVAAVGANADLSPLEGFDADAAFARYSEGANNRFMRSLQSGLDNLRNSAAGGNRLNTGFFDLDAGKLGRDLRQDAANDISAAALQTNQQNLAARTSLSGFRTQLAQTNAQVGTEAALANARNALEGGRLRLDAVSTASRNAQGRAEIQRGDRAFRASRYDRQTSDLQELAELRRRDRAFEAERFDKDGNRLLAVADRQRGDRDFNYGTQRDRLDRADRRTTNDRATWLEAATQSRAGWAAGNDARFKAADMMRGDRDFNENTYRDRRSTYLDMLSGMTDRAQGAENARQQRRADSRNGWVNLAGTLAGAGASWALNKWGGGGAQKASNTTQSVRYARPASQDWTQSLMS